MLKFFIISLIFLSFISISTYAQTGTVVFKVSGIQVEKGGAISTGIFKKANFPKVGKAFKSLDNKIKSSYQEVTLKNVPIGTYGAVVFQDTNENQKLETNFVGLPKEPIGFANNATIKFGPPKFEKASIVVKENKTTIVQINLK